MKKAASKSGTGLVWYTSHKYWRFSSVMIEPQRSKSVSQRKQQETVCAELSHPMLVRSFCSTNLFSHEAGALRTSTAVDGGSRKKTIRTHSHHSYWSNEPRWEIVDDSGPPFLAFVKGGVTTAMLISFMLIERIEQKSRPRHISGRPLSGSCGIEVEVNMQCDSPRPRRVSWKKLMLKVQSS